MLHNPQSNCLDPMKEYRPCRSACQVTCDTRTRPICPHAGRCNPGCQCKLPYILESSNDLENSKCVLPAECPSNSEPLPTPGKVVYRPPVFPFHAQEDTDTSMFTQFPHGALGFGIDRSKQMHCSDPLKNFLTCGSACPGEFYTLKTRYIKIIILWNYFFSGLWTSCSCLLLPMCFWMLL